MANFNKTYKNKTYNKNISNIMSVQTQYGFFSMDNSPDSNNIMKDNNSIIKSNSIDFVPHDYIQNKELILNKNFFEVFDFFDDNKKNIIQSFSFYHKSGIKIYFNYNPDILMGNYACLKMEGNDYNSIYISIDEKYNIFNLNIVNLCHYSAKIIINLLKYINRIVLLGDALGIRIDESIDLTEEKIKMMNYPTVKINNNDCKMSNRSLLMGKNIFDIIKIINPSNLEYKYIESDIKIKICYETSSFFTPMVTFSLNLNTHNFCALCFYFEKHDNFIIKEIYMMYDYPFAIEFILNKLKHVDKGIEIIADALGIKLDYTQDELINMQIYL